MNIVLINPEYPSLRGQGQGGIATYVYAMANALYDAGQNVHVLVRKGIQTNQLNGNIGFHSFDFHPVVKPFSYFSRWLNGDIFWEQGCSKAALDVILELHKENPVDIVEIPEYNGLASQFKQPLPFSVVITFHTPTALVDTLNKVVVTMKQRRVYAYERNALKNARAYRCPSKSLATQLTDLYSLPQSCIKIIRNPISTKEFDDIGREKKAPVNSERCDILFAGRLEQRKGAEILLRSLKDILDIKPNINITFAGETEIQGAIDFRHAIERSLTNESRQRVWFLGPVDSAKLNLLYCRSDIFLVPSLFENAPYTILEAMAARLPIIASNTGGINEMIQHRKTGLLFAPDNLTEFISCVTELVCKPILREEFAQNAYNFVGKQYNPETIAEESIAFYKTLKKTHN